MKTKAIIPVAGVGTRLRPHTHTVPKALMNVAGKPILAHILDQLPELGIRDVVMVVGYMGGRIKDYVKKNYKLKVTYVEQRERRGLGHAVHLTAPHIKNSPVLVVLGDTIFKADFSKVVGGKKTYIGVKEVSDPEHFGVVQIAGGRVKRLVEKPEIAPSNLAIVGVYYISETELLFQCIREIMRKRIKTKGEYQLTDALQLMLNRGAEMRTFPVRGWYDCGKTDTLLSANRDLLDLGSPAPKIPGSVVVAPVAIDRTARVENCVIGPHVSIAAGASVSNSVVRNCIINDNASVQDILLDASVVGENAVVRAGFKKVNVGDSSEVQLT
ncbi:MAG: NTP transferase domain-containing protein [Candidatus Eiseniibacteriota bacterium]|nr:MAG: NTP transferase domain-containing protein [Candidatus Eisenbacteria bacterium]